MKVVSAIAYACSDLRQAGQDGFLMNQSMVIFIFCKALMQQLRDAQIVYDGRACRDSGTRPNLFIWQDGTTPVVLFIGNLRYGLHDNLDCNEQIQSLKNYAAKPAIKVLTSDPDSLKYIERPMAISTDLELGFFNVDVSKNQFHYQSAH